MYEVEKSDFLTRMRNEQSEVRAKQQREQKTVVRYNLSDTAGIIITLVGIALMILMMRV
jgi:uncharacterized membrane protein YkgB